MKIVSLYKRHRSFVIISLSFLFIQCGGGGGSSGGGGASSSFQSDANSLSSFTDSLNNSFAKDSSQSHCMGAICDQLKSAISGASPLFPEHISINGLACALKGFDVRKVNAGQSHESSSVGQTFNSAVLKNLNSSEYLNNTSTIPEGCLAGTQYRGLMRFSTAQCGTISVKGCYMCDRDPGLSHPNPSFKPVKCPEKTPNVDVTVNGTILTFEFYKGQTPPLNLTLQGGSFVILIGNSISSSGAFHFSANQTNGIIEFKHETESAGVATFTFDMNQRKLVIDLGGIISLYPQDKLSFSFSSAGYVVNAVVNEMHAACNND